MSTSLPPDLLLPPESATFRVERFDWSSDGRLEVEGRWTRVRGLRFMRPVLTVSVPHGRRRVVALLEHKPWEPSEGGSWVAAFPWEGDREAVGSAQLAVSTGLVVDLPAPGPDAAGQAPVPPAVTPAVMALRRAEQAEARVVRETEAARALLLREREDHERVRHALEGARQTVERTLAGERAVSESLRLDLAQARARLEDAQASARTESRALRAELSRLGTELEEANGRVHELAQERSDLLAERDRIAAARDAALELAQRTDVTEERDALARKLDETQERVRSLERRLERGTFPPQGERTLRLAPQDSVRRIPRPQPARSDGPGAETGGEGAQPAGTGRLDPSPGPAVRRIPRPSPGTSAAGDGSGAGPSDETARGGQEPPTVRRIPRTPRPEPEGAPSATKRDGEPDDPAATAPREPLRPVRDVPELIDDLAPEAATRTRGAQPEVKPLLTQAEPLPRSSVATWSRRIAAVAVLVIVLIVLAVLVL